MRLIHNCPLCCNVDMLYKLASVSLEASLSFLGFFVMPGVCVWVGFL